MAERGRALLRNTLLLTLTALLMRTVGMAFQVWLSKKIGAAGIGLFQLIMSVSMLAATFSISGIRFATTRLVSMELGLGSDAGVRAAVKRCLIYSMCFGLAAAGALWFGAGHIGGVWIGDTRTVLSLRILALSLPAFSLSAVLAGYFTAVCRVIKSAAVQIIEQVIRISVVAVALSLSRSEDVARSCAVVVAGGVAGELSSFFLLYILYRLDRRRYTASGETPEGLTRRMFSIAIPLALSAYARTALSTLENLLVPRGFKRSGASAEKSLADYGLIQGMVFPIITFPSAFFYSLAELLVPELTQAQVSGDTQRISTLAGATLRLCLTFSLGVTAILFCFSNELGLAIYDSAEVGRYIKILSLLMPVMYLDSVTDGMLRGLGLQLYSMKYNIIDAVISVALVYLLLPGYAVTGYLFMICFTEVFNFTLSIRRLEKVSPLRFSVWNTLKSAFCAFGSVNLAKALLRLITLPLSPTGASVAVHTVAAALLYVLLLWLFNCVGGEDLAWVRSLAASAPVP
jgi:stage V sporulation protein B